MTTATKAPKLASAADFALDSEKVAEVLDRLKGSTSIELKVMLPYDNRDILRRLGFDPVDAEPRQTYFFDTPKFELNKAGLIVRARRSPHGRGDTTVKLRPVDPEALDRKLLRDADFKVEIDVMHGGYVCSASATGRCTADEVYDASEGRIPLKSIFSDQQREFYKAHAPDGIRMKHLVPIGPAFLLRLKSTPRGFDRPMTIELWLYPDGSRILELSTKGLPHEAFQLGAEFRGFLGESRLMRVTDAKTKTAQTLQVFTRHGDKVGRAAVV
jgi:hypothetical protein